MSIEQTARSILVVRHGERCDFVFNGATESWMTKAFDSNGRYSSIDMNMPRTVPDRRDGWRSYEYDTPLTRVGHMQANLTGRALRDTGMKIDVVYSSPALRCVQTASGIVTGLGTSQLVNVEPGFFEWMQWYRGVRPRWMQLDELKRSGYPVNVEYRPIIKPSALPAEEPLSDYYERSYAVVKRVLQSHSENQSKGCILIVAHAESLDTCTRQLCGGDPRGFEHFWYLLHQTPHVGCVHVTEDQPFWRLADPPIPSFTQSANSPFDSRQLALPAATLEEMMKSKKSKD